VQGRQPLAIDGNAESDGSVPVYADGEPFADAPLRVRVRPGALRVPVPAPAGPGRPAPGATAGAASADPGSAT
jgi:hypothetical protein